MNGFLEALSVWAATRASGLTAYLFLVLSVGAGIMMSLRTLNPRTKMVLRTLHESSGWFGFLFGIVHGGVLLFDPYVGYSLRELLIPFTAHSHPVLNGLGTLSFYVTLALIVSSDFMKKLGRTVWKTIHFLAYPGFIFSFLHGMMIGSDSQYAWAQLMYICTAGLIVLLTVIRIVGIKADQAAEYPA